MCLFPTTDRALARKAGKIWMKHGALEYVECLEDDVKSGKRISFPQAVKRKTDEVLVFAWIVYRSRAQRDRVNTLVMAGPRLPGMDGKNMPFDGKRTSGAASRPPCTSTPRDEALFTAAPTAQHRFG